MRRILLLTLVAALGAAQPVGAVLASGDRGPDDPRTTPSGPKTDDGTSTATTATDDRSTAPPRDDVATTPTPAPGRPTAEPPIADKPVDGPDADQGRGNDKPEKALDTDEAAEADDELDAVQERTPPEQGERVLVTPGRGTVKVKRPDGAPTAALDTAAGVPVGAVLDTRHGTVVLRAALADGTVQTAEFWGGVFEVRQGADGSGIVDLHLRGPALRCGRPKARTAGAAPVARRRRSARRTLWGKDDHGKFRTHGRDSVATVRGTRWLVEDTCRGTRTKVLEGAVLVTLKTGRTVLLKAGTTYVAPRSKP